MTGTKQQLHQNRILSVFLPPSLPQIRWSREIYLAKLSPQKLGKGIQKRRKILFETRKAPPPIPLLVLSPRKAVSLRGACRGSQGRRPWSSKMENYDSLPFFREILLSPPPFSRPFPFLFPAGLLIQLSRVPCRDQCATPLVCGVWTGGPFVL